MKIFTPLTLMHTRSFVQGMDFDKIMRAAEGYSELGMTSDALDHLDSLEGMEKRPVVLELRLHILMRATHWLAAIQVGKELCLEAPECSAGFLHTAYCLHEVGKTGEAKDTLLSGPAELKSQATYHYNLACYDAMLGNAMAARTHLQRSIAMDSGFRKFAAKDPDLVSIREQEA